MHRKLLVKKPFSSIKILRAALTVLGIFALSTASTAQVSSYTFSQTAGTYNQIVGGTVLGAATGNTSATNLNSEIYPVTLPFGFNFNGIVHNSINVSSNGFITFGSTAPSTTLSSPISSSIAFDGVVSAFGRNISSYYLSGKAGEIRWETVGTAPSREVVIQWSDFRPNSTTVTTTVYSFSFQIRLKEVGDVQVIYNGGGYVAGTGSISGTAQVGLRGATNTDYNNRLNASTVLFANSTAGTSNSSNQAFNTVNATPGMPPAGLTYTWSAPSCFSPSNLSSSTVTTTSGTVTFTAPNPAPANGYEIYYSTSPTDPTAATVLDPTNSVTSTSNTVTINGLNPGTLYYFWVRAKCSATETSAWSNSENFTTNCVAINAPYTENFDTTPNGSSTNNTAPACWRYLETSGFTGYGYVSTSNNNSAPHSFYLYNSTGTGSQMLVSPQTTNLSDGTKWTTFYAKSTVAGTALEVGTMSDPTDPATFTIIGTPITLTTTHTEYNVVIPAGTNQYLVFRHGMNANSRNIYLDDITVENTPTCFEPSNIAVSAQTSDTGTLTWVAPTSGGAPMNYTVYYSTTNTAPTASTVLDNTNSVTVTGNTATITGLAPSTTYYVWIRSNCSATDSSVWTEAGSTLRTECLPPTITGTTGAAVCAGNSATITASSDAGATINWYDTATGGSSLGTGNSFTTPVLTANTTYYVAASTGSSAFVGPINPNSLNAGGSTNTSTSYYVQFEVSNNPVTLISTDVFPGSAGQNTTLEILEGPGTFSVIHTQTFTSTIASDGTQAQTVPINITLQPGTYRIRILGGSYYRNYQSNATFPYTVGDFSITTGSNAATNSYYFTYNLQIGNICESARTPVTVQVDTTPGCVMSTNEVNTADALQMYPNPFADIIFFKNGKDIKSAQIYDMSGKLVKDIEKANSEIQVGDLPAGTYLISVEMKDGSKTTLKGIKR